MDITVIVGFVNLFCLGLLAGEEFTIRYGVRAPLASLEDKAHILLRQALIRKLRILVPIIFAMTLISGIAVTFLNSFNFSSEFGLRCAGLVALITFITVTLKGTVPINQAALSWNPAAPPQNWRGLVNRWEQLDNVRFWVAVLAFALFLSAMALQ